MVGIRQLVHGRTRVVSDGRKSQPQPLSPRVEVEIGEVGLNKYDDCVSLLGGLRKGMSKQNGIKRLRKTDQIISIR